MTAEPCCSYVDVQNALSPTSISWPSLFRGISALPGLKHRRDDLVTSSDITPEIYRKSPQADRDQVILGLWFAFQLTREELGRWERW